MATQLPQTARVALGGLMLPSREPKMCLDMCPRRGTPECKLRFWGHQESEIKVSVAQSCLTLGEPRNCSPPGSFVHGILQARTLEWVAVPVSRRIFPTQGSKPGLSHCRWILYHQRHQGSPWVSENLTVLGVGLGRPEMRVAGMQRAYLSVPDVHALVEGAAGQVLPVGAEGHTVHGFLVLGERVDAHAPLHVPKSDGRIEGGAGKTQRSPRIPVGSEKLTTAASSFRPVSGGRDSHTKRVLSCPVSERFRDCKWVRLPLLEHDSRCTEHRATVQGGDTCMPVANSC